MDFSYGVAVTVKRPGGWDAYGNPLPGIQLEIKGCAPAPAGTTEPNPAAGTVEWDVDLLCPYDADFQSTDVILLPGDPTEYQAVGKVRRFRSPFTGWDAGGVVRLKGVQG